MTRRTIGLLTIFGAACFAGTDGALDLKAPVIPLWLHGAPGSEGKTAPERWISQNDAFHRVTDIHNPSLTVFLPPAGKATGVAYVIAPGGGHKYLVMDLEGQFVAQKLNNIGIAAFVLKSRLANAEGSTYKVAGESLADVQRAIRVVRSRAKEWGVNPARVGVMGFSAGGELASLAETRYDAGKPDAADPIDRASCRPDFAVLGYPGGKSANFVPTKQTPPTVIVVNADDNLSVTAAEYFVALKKAGVPAELHVYTRGGHGFGMTGRNAEFQKLPVSKWPGQLQEWMVDAGLLP